MSVAFPGLLRDAPRRDNEAILERYFNDIYSIYLNKLSSYMIAGVHDEDQAKKLRSLLEEIIKVKTLLHTEEDKKQYTIE